MENTIHKDVSKYDLVKRAYYINMPNGKIKRIIFAIKMISNNLFKNPAKILKSINIFSYGKEAISLRNLYWLCPFLEEEYDVILCHFGGNGRHIAIIKDLVTNCRLITIFHGYDVSATLLNDRNYYKLLFERGDLFLPISLFWKKRLRELGCNESRMIVHHMGINLDRFQFKERVRYEDQPTTIVTVGRLVEKKGHEYAIRAVANLIKSDYKIRYLIVGDGPLKKDLEILIYKLGIEKNINLLGGLEQDNVITIYDQSHIFLLASVTASNGDMEGIPVVLMEAQAMGMPVISTLHSGIPEVVINGKSGVLVEEKNVEELENAIKFLYENPHMWSEFGKYGRNHIQTNFEINKLNDELVTHITSLTTRN
jgi:colanic acid/amylovoran biosynthesis glycosyltransferase